jgi:uncharacterized protein YbaA (DUF1428 family)
MEFTSAATGGDGCASEKFRPLVGFALCHTSFAYRQQCWSEIMPYVDGFLLAVPKAKLDAYKKAVDVAAPTFKEHGAVDYVECVGDDVPYGELTSFPRAVQAKDDEVVIFSWVTYPSRAARDAANAKIMKDERLMEAMKDVDVDGKRMIFGGFVPFKGL